MPAIPADLLGVSAVTCVRLAPDGAVAQVYVVASTGDRAKDAEIEDYVRQLQWNPAGLNATMRGGWFPMPIAFGAKPPPLPPSCRPPPPPPVPPVPPDA